MNEERNQDSAPKKNGAQSNSSKVGGDIYVQDATKSFGVTKALNGVNFKANFETVPNPTFSMLITLYLGSAGLNSIELDLSTPNGTEHIT